MACAVLSAGLLFAIGRQIDDFIRRRRAPPAQELEPTESDPEGALKTGRSSPEDVRPEV